MKIVLLGENSIRLEQSVDRLTIEAPEENAPYSPFQMLASALATCTFSVLQSWATHAKIQSHDIALEVKWEFAENPHRVDNIEVSIFWPSLPAERHDTAKRVATKCTIHNTLANPAPVTISVAQQG